MVMKKIMKKAIHVKLKHPSGRITTKKLMLKSRSLKAVQREYLGTGEHFRTEAYPIAIVKKPIKRIPMKRKRIGVDPFNFRF